MNQSAQFDLHPEAESLNAFVERTLPEPERGQIFAHMAVCSRCRQVVRLAQQAADIEMSLTQSDSEKRKVARSYSWKPNWRLVWGGMAACAAVLTFAVLANYRHAQPASQVAENVPVEANNGSKLSSSTATKPISPPDKSATQISSPALPDRRRRDGVRVDSSPAPANKVVSPVANAISKAENQATIRQPQKEATVADAKSASPSISSDTQPVAVSASVSVNASTLDVTADNGLQRQSPELTIQPAPVVAGTLPLESHATTLTSPSSIGLASPTADRVRGRTAMAAQSPQPSVSAMSRRSFSGGALSNAAAKSKSTSTPDVDAARNVLYRKLPNGLIAVSTAAAHHRLLAIDSAGGLFLSTDYGANWSDVSQQWSGRALQVRAVQVPASTSTTVSVTPSSQAGCPTCSTQAIPTNSGLVFEILTDSVATWTSSDGITWKLK